MKVSERSVMIHEPVEKVFPGMDEAASAQPLSEGLITPLEVLDHRVGTMEVLEWELGKKITGTAVAGPVQVRWQLLFEPLADGTRMTGVSEVRVSGVLQVIEPLVAHLATRAIDDILATAKRDAEYPRRQPLATSTPDAPSRSSGPPELDDEFVSLLTCPVCKTSVRFERGSLICSRCARRYPIRDGIPVMLEEEAEMPENRRR
jgi:uncharacterized protein